MSACYCHCWWERVAIDVIGSSLIVLWQYNMIVLYRERKTFFPGSDVLDGE